MARLKVLFVFRQLGVFEAIEGPRDSWYGMGDFDNERVEVSHVARNEEGRGMIRWVWLPVEQLITKLSGAGFSLYVMMRKWSRFGQAKLIISTADAVGLPVLLAKRLGLLKAKVLYISQGLTDSVERITPTSRRRRVKKFYGWLLGAADKVVVLGYGAVSPLVDMIGVEESKIVVVPWGVDNEFWSAGKERLPGLC